MAVISVPLSPTLSKLVDSLVKRGIAANKADAIRKALIAYAEDQAVLDVLISEQESKEGKVFSGDLRMLAKQLRQK